MCERPPINVKLFNVTSASRISSNLGTTMPGIYLQAHRLIPFKCTRQEGNFKSVGIDMWQP